MMYRSDDPHRRDDGLHPDSVNIFLRYVEGSRSVRGIEKIRFDRYVVEREKDQLDVVLVNIYTVSELDVLDILAENPGVNAIVTVSGWNGNTKRAEDMALREGVGLFTFREFMGAVHYYGDDFLTYVPPDERDDRVVRRS
jgi:hypothetical protein